MLLPEFHRPPDRSKLEEEIDLLRRQLGKLQKDKAKGDDRGDAIKDVEESLNSLNRKLRHSGREQRTGDEVV